MAPKNVVLGWYGSRSTESTEVITEEPLSKKPCLGLKQRGAVFEVLYNKAGGPDPLADQRAYGGHTKSLFPWPAPLPESTPTRPLFFQQQLRFKHGGCPEHPNRALVPSICTEEKNPWRGTVRLYCRGVREYTPGQWRKCLCSFPVHVKDLNKMPLHIQDEHRSITASLHRASGR